MSGLGQVLPIRWSRLAGRSTPETRRSANRWRSAAKGQKRWFKRTVEYGEKGVDFGLTERSR